MKNMADFFYMRLLVYGVLLFNAIWPVPKKKMKNQRDYFGGTTHNDTLICIIKINCKRARCVQIKNHSTVILKVAYTVPHHIRAKAGKLYLYIFLVFDYIQIKTHWNTRFISCASRIKRRCTLIMRWFQFNNPILIKRLKQNIHVFMYFICTFSYIV